MATETTWNNVSCLYCKQSPQLQWPDSKHQPLSNLESLEPSSLPNLLEGGGGTFLLYLGGVGGKRKLLVPVAGSGKGLSQALDSNLNSF